MEELIFSGEARRLCKIAGKPVDLRTFNRWVEKGLIKTGGLIPPDRRIFKKSDVLAFAKTLPKKRKKGYPLIVSVIIVCIMASSIVLASGPVSKNRILEGSGKFAFGQISDFRQDQYLLDSDSGRLWRIVKSDRIGTTLEEIPFLRGNDSYSYSPYSIEKFSLPKTEVKELEELEFENRQLLENNKSKENE